MLNLAGGPASCYQVPLISRPKRLPNSICPKKTYSKELSVVAEQMLLVRHRQITDLKNELTVLKQQVHNMKRENHMLQELERQQDNILSLQYGGYKGNIMKVIMHYDSELHVLCETLRQNKEKKQLAERGQKDAKAQLERAKDQVRKLQQLVNNKHLEERDELTCKLQNAQMRAQASEQRAKNLEKQIELTAKQLASQRRQTQKTLKVVDTLKEEVEKLQSARPKVREKGTKSFRMVLKAENIERKEDSPLPPPVTPTDDNQDDNYFFVKENQTKQELEDGARAGERSTKKTKDGLKKVKRRRKRLR